MPPKRLDNLLNANDGGDLGQIIRRAREMGELVQVLQASLPAEAAPGIIAANIRGDGELIVLAASSAWAAKLRFQADLMITAARQTGAEIHSCKVRVKRN